MLDLAISLSPQRAEAADLDVLARKIRQGYAELQTVWCNALHRALDLGDLLIEAQSKLPAGTAWKKWLKDNCFLSTRTAFLYTRLAHHRAEVEDKIAGAGDLSIRAAQRFIAEPKTKTAAKKKVVPLITWATMSIDARRALLADADAASLLASIPDTLRQDLERRFEGNRKRNRRSPPVIEGTAIRH